MNYYELLHYARRHKTLFFILYFLKATLAFLISVFLGFYLYAIGVKIPSFFIYIFIALGFLVYVKYQKNERKGLTTLKAIKKHKALIVVMSLISYIILISGSNNFMYEDTQVKNKTEYFTQVSKSSFGSFTQTTYTQKNSFTSKIRHKIKNFIHTVSSHKSPRPFLLTLLTIFVLTFLIALLLFLTYAGLVIGCALSCGGTEYTVAIMIGFIFTSIVSIIFTILTLKWLTQLLKKYRGKK